MLASSTTSTMMVPKRREMYGKLIEIRPFTQAMRREVFRWFIKPSPL
jgi:hypothetical protein